MKHILSVSPIACIWLLVSPTAQAIVDINNNGLSDLWEKAHNNGDLFPTNFDPQADPDGDGWTNAQEAAAGTDPSDANPPTGYLQPQITYYPAVYYTDPETNITVTQSPATVTLNWPTLPGKQYTLHYSTDLAPGNWSPLDTPRIGTGWDMGNGITLTQPDGSIADRIFWRVAVTDPVPAIDTDGDGLGNYEEYLADTNPVISDSDEDTLSDYAELIAGTNPNHADEDGDGITDPLEIAAGTDSKNQDTDGDAIPDWLDNQPLLSAQAFADADDDGIPDANDAAPNQPRGPKPLIISENASGNPNCELEKDKSSNFILTVSNPAGPAPTSSDFKLYLNGTEEAANITALTTPPSATGTQRFNFSWLAKVTTSYPAQTLQNISLRFRDSQYATTWLNVARADVAEWEGMIAGVSSYGVSFPDYPQVLVASHYKGVKQSAERFLHGGSVWYRGPKSIPLLHATGSDTGSTAQIGAERYPLFVISKSGSTYSVEQTFDISDPVAYPHHGKFYVNRWSTDITMSPSAVGSIGIPAGAIRFQAFPPAPETGTPNFGVLGHSFIDGENKTIYTNVWTLTEPNLPFRVFSGLVFFNSITSEGESYREIDGIGGVNADIGATITPHSAGTLEYPGMPISPPGFPPAPYNNWPSQTPLLPIQSGQWHKLVLKVGPDAGALSNGITLKLGTGGEGENDPQTGFTLQTPGTGSFEPLTIPANGQIEMAPTSGLYQKLTSTDGLTLFLKRDSTVSEFHRLGLDLIPRRSTYPVQRFAALDLPPLELEILHIEKERDENGNETSTPVNPGANTLLRDEIATLKITLPTKGEADWDLKIDLEPEEMKTEKLGARGKTQMYDFGRLDNGTVTPLSLNTDGNTKAGPYDIKLPYANSGVQTFRIVVNKDGKFRLRLKSTDHGIDVVSQELTVTKRIRKYARRPENNNADFDKHDLAFEDAAAAWGTFYNKALDPDILKAMGMQESTLGHGDDAVDILTVGNAGDHVLDILRKENGYKELEAIPNGNNWTIRYLDYDAAASPARTAIHWGTCWLFHKAQHTKRVADANNPPHYVTLSGWNSWEDAVGYYGPAKEPYIFVIEGPWKRGRRDSTTKKNADSSISLEMFDESEFEYIWPILSNQRSRK